MRSARVLGGALLAVLALAGCTPTTTGDDFRGFERQSLAQGKLRVERAPLDAPYTNRDLVRNFDRIAFGLEPGINNGRARLDRLERWEESIRWWLFADGPEAAAAVRDVAATFNRLAAATGLDIAEAPDAATSNFDVLFLGERDYDVAIDWASEVLDGAEADVIRHFRRSSFPCMARIFSRAEADGGMPAGSHSYALVLIRKGFSDLFRLSCVEEELTQALGLGNDDPRVRPSIFNDDEEFALLTVHEETLLRVLYDPRLRSGMPHAEAMLVVRDIVAEIGPGG